MENLDNKIKETELLTAQYIQAINNEMNLLTVQYKAQMAKLEHEKIKVLNPKLWEFVQNNFVNSPIYFSRELFRSSDHHLLRSYWKIEYASVPVKIQSIDETKGLLVGLKPGNQISPSLFAQLVELTKDQFPLEYEVVEGSCHLGIDYFYGKIITENKLNIKHVELLLDDMDINSIGFYYKS